MSGTTTPDTARLAARLHAVGVAGAGRTARAVADDIRATAAGLAPGRLGAALDVAPTDDGAVVIAPGFARFVEFGTRVMPARPFLRPAIDRVRGDTQSGR